MTKEIRPMIFRKHGRALALTIPAEYVHEVALLPGDIALFKREPDGLRLRIVRHPKQDEFANETENQLATKLPVEQEETVVDST
jgi:antitoxin component of MazEF toxin-antitoxin module